MKAEDVPDEWVEAARKDKQNVRFAPGMRKAYLDGLRSIIAAVAPLIAAAEREACAQWHDAQAEGESVLADLAEVDGDREGERTHRHLANEHDASAAAIRSRTGDK